MAPSPIPIASMLSACYSPLKGALRAPRHDDLGPLWLRAHGREVHLLPRARAAARAHALKGA